MPRVSIGLPVYNGAATLRAALDSLLGQTFRDFELVISDNASTDETGAIAQDYAARDSRVRYVRQATNIGALPNFSFVLNEATAPLFMWAAADDTREATFLERTLRLLEFSDTVSATGLFQQAGRRYWTPIRGYTAGERALKFLNIAWRSNALFYGVHRTDAVRSFPMTERPYAAFDWAFILHLAAQGNLLMSNQTWIEVGSSGASNRPDKWRGGRTSAIEYLLPLYHVSLYTLRLSRTWPWMDRAAIYLGLAKLNFQALYDEAFSAAYQYYKKHFRRYVRRDASAHLQGE